MAEVVLELPDLLLSRAMSLSLHSAFEATCAERGAATYTLRQECVASLRTSGRIGAADPLSSSRIDGFERAVPSGRHPVELLLATREQDTRVALARVVFRSGQPVRFELALRPGQDVRALRAGERFGFGVDAGTGCFADDGIAPEADAILAQFEGKDASSWGWAVTNDARCVAFSSGFGDGVYSSYFGLDEKGEPMCLVTDFGVIDVELPRHNTDEAFRAAEAERLARLVFQRLPWLGGERHGEVWTTVTELGELAEAGASVAPRFVAALVKTESELERDVLAHAVGRLLASDGAYAAMLDALPLLSDDALSDVLRKWQREARASAPAPFVEALAKRWESGTEELRGHLLATIQDATPAERHSSLTRFADETVKRALDAIDDPLAARRAIEALEPYRETVWREDRQQLPKNPAPASLLERLPALAARTLDDDLRRYSFLVLALNGCADLVAEVLDDPNNPARLSAAMSLARDPIFRERANAVFRDIANDETRSAEGRYDAISRLDDVRERCAGFLKLGLSGFDAALIQLGYIVAEAPDEAISALKKLVKEGPTAAIRERSRKALKTASKRASKK